MSEKEFEIYLSVLSRLLRLSPAQKSAISDELRDHMEERLASLIQAGVSRDDAIKRAIDEFGDVTGLALDLTQVSRTPLRKVLVRSTAAVSVAAAVIVSWIALFAPEDRMPAPRVVQAQQKPASDARQQTPAQISTDEELFPEFLTQIKDVYFLDSPLMEVCGYLSDLHDVPVVLQRQALNDAGIPTDTLVSLDLKGVTLEEVLNHISRQASLTWQVDGGVVQITSQDAARYITRNFSLLTLTKQGHSVSSLQDVVRLAADLWNDESPGGGTMALVGDSLVVRQTFQNQRRISQVLSAIEQRRPMTVMGTCTGRERLLEALRERTSVEFVDTPLVEAVKFLSEVMQVPILIDQRALAEAQIALDASVTLTLKNRSLEKLLEFMLADHHLTFQLRDGVILITIDQIPSGMSWVVYNVSDFASSEEIQTQLSNAILHTTSGQWMENDGNGGELVMTEVGGCLVAKNDDRVQFEIQNLIEQLRRSRKDRGTDAEKAPSKKELVTRRYRMSKEMAADLATALPRLVSPGNWNAVNGEMPTVELVASSPRMEHVDGLVSGGNHEVQVINPGAEKKQHGPGQVPANESSVKSIVVRPRSTLIIRQTPEVHREIKKFLMTLDVPVEYSQPLPGGGQGDGFIGGGMGGGGFF